MTRRQFEQSEHWLFVKRVIGEQLKLLETRLLNEDEPREFFRAQGAAQALMNLRDDTPPMLAGDEFDLIFNAASSPRKEKQNGR